MSSCEQKIYEREITRILGYIVRDKGKTHEKDTGSRDQCLYFDREMNIRSELSNKYTLQKLFTFSIFIIVFFLKIPF